MFGKAYRVVKYEVWKLRKAYGVVKYKVWRLKEAYGAVKYWSGGSGKLAEL